MLQILIAVLLLLLVESSFRANLALFEFRPGKRSYVAHAELDELRSNELTIELTIDD